MSNSGYSNKIRKRQIDSVFLDHFWNAITGDFSQYFIQSFLPLIFSFIFSNRATHFFA